MSRKRQEPNKMKKKMSKEQLHLALTKKRECDARALSIVERLIENDVDQMWMLENLQDINRCHMEDVVEERAILKRCGYALCDKPLKLNINQKYHISTRSNKVYDVSRRKNFCSNNCYGAGNFIIEQMLTSPLWLRDPREKPQFQLLPVSGLARKSTPGDEVDLGIENITVDPKKSSETSDTLNSEDSQAPEDSVKKDLTFEETEDYLNQEKPERLKERVIREDLDEILDLRESIENPDASVALDKTRKDNTLVVDCDLRSERIEIPPEAKIAEEKQWRGNRGKTDSKRVKFDPRCIVERIERYLREWITLDSLVLLLGDESLRLEKMGEKKEDLKSEEVKKKYVQLCQRVNSLQIEPDSEDEESRIDPKPLPDYGLLKEEGQKLEIKVKAFFEGRTAMDNTKPSDVTSGKETEDSDTFLPALSEKEPKALRRRIVLEKLDKVLPEMLRTLAGGQFVVNECIGNNGCGKSVKVLVNTFSLSASNVIPKPAEWNLLGLVFIKLLSISEPRLRFLLGTERAKKYITMILMSYNLEPNYLDGLVAAATDVEFYRRNEELLRAEEINASNSS